MLVLIKRFFIKSFQRKIFVLADTSQLWTTIKMTPSHVSGGGTMKHKNVFCLCLSITWLSDFALCTSFLHPMIELDNSENMGDTFKFPTVLMGLHSIKPRL